jgi:hypothetical protein
MPTSSAPPLPLGPPPAEAAGHAAGTLTAADVAAAASAPLPKPNLSSEAQEGEGEGRQFQEEGEEHLDDEEYQVGWCRLTL